VNKVSKEVFDAAYADYKGYVSLSYLFIYLFHIIFLLMLYFIIIIIIIPKDL